MIKQQLTELGYTETMPQPSIWHLKLSADLQWLIEFTNTGCDLCEWTGTGWNRLVTVFDESFLIAMLEAIGARAS